MEKKAVKNYGNGPWELKKTQIKDFSIVNEFNRKNAVTLGRIFYIIEPIGYSYMFRGTFTIDPKFTKGWWNYPFKPWQSSDLTHFKVYFNGDVDYNEWAQSNKTIIDRFINEKTLYIKSSDPLLTYYQTEK